MEEGDTTKQTQTTIRPPTERTKQQREEDGFKGVLQKERIDYRSGYIKALKDIYEFLYTSEKSFRSDRRNNIKNVLWLLECIIENPDYLATYGTETPIYFEKEGKRLVYYIKKEEWPVLGAEV